MHSSKEKDLDTELKINQLIHESEGYFRIDKMTTDSGIQRFMFKMVADHEWIMNMWANLQSQPYNTEINFYIGETKKGFRKLVVNEDPEWMFDSDDENLHKYRYKVKVQIWHNAGHKDDIDIIVGSTVEQ